MGVAIIKAEIKATWMIKLIIAYKSIWCIFTRR
jgi:hypothetical protein